MWTSLILRLRKNNEVLTDQGTAMLVIVGCTKNCVSAMLAQYLERVSGSKYAQNDYFRVLVFRRKIKSTENSRDMKFTHNVDYMIQIIGKQNLI